MLYMNFDDEGTQSARNRGEIVEDYLRDFADVESKFPDEFTPGEKFSCWLQMIQIHFTCMAVQDESDDGEGWKG